MALPSLFRRWFGRCRRAGVTRTRPLYVTRLEERLAPAAAPGHFAGLSVAWADVTGDGAADLTVCRGDGTVRIANGLTGVTVREFTPFLGFSGPLSVAAGDLTGDGRNDIVVGAGFGGGPRVAAFDGVTGNTFFDIMAFEESFRGGVTVAVGDVTGDGRSDIAVGAGYGGGPRVVVLDGTTGTSVRTYFAYESQFRGGVSVALGDVNDDGHAEVFTGSGPGGGPRLRTFDGATGAVLRDQFVGDANARDGLAVAAGDFDGNGFGPKSPR